MRSHDYLNELGNEFGEITLAGGLGYLRDIL